MRVKEGFHRNDSYPTTKCEYCRLPTCKHGNCLNMACQEYENTLCSCYSEYHNYDQWGNLRRDTGNAR